MSAKQPKRSAAKTKAPAKAAPRKRAAAKKAAPAKPKAKAAPAKKAAAVPKKKAARKATAPKRAAKSRAKSKPTARAAHPCAAEPRTPDAAAAHLHAPYGPVEPTAEVSTPTLFSPPLPSPFETKAEERPDQGDADENARRGNRLVPTNAVHTTRRRVRRRITQAQAAILLGGVALVALFIIGGGDRPHDSTPLARLSTTGQQTWLPGQRNARDLIDDPVKADPERARERRSGPPAAQPRATPNSLRQGHLVELEEMLARLDLNPSPADGVVDAQTTSAIRLYQQIAGLPINGEPSEALLNDMREVVRILEGD